MRKAKNRTDYAYIQERVNYYNKLSSKADLPKDSPRIGDLRLKGNSSVYFFDVYEYLRWFDPSSRWNYVFGDVTTVPSAPAIVKSRPLVPDNANSVLLKLNKIRHFVFLNDKTPFREKEKLAVFRARVNANESRIRLMEMFHNHPTFDFGSTDKGNNKTQILAEWQKSWLSLHQHLNYKFILALEGNDVASNLKWVMSSNSVAVMPRPTCETWFMEGKLIPDFHYIEIKHDFSDLEEKLNFYEKNPHLAEEISRNANAYAAQFFDLEREKLISLLVLEKYFEATATMKNYI
ncbi:MAG: lipopolysaccharide A protein [Defluviitaleaceae bacterium]|nr:lipopolysaccharide A protein [Defluviitaleaceae bacterium]